MLIGRLNTEKDDEDPAGHSETTDTAESWAALSAQSPLSAVVPLPGSKSLTNRELILSALADAPGAIHSPLHSRDSQLMIDGLRALGTQIDEISGAGTYGADLRITPAQELTGSTTLACGLAGTVMRFLPAVAALALGPVAFDGDPYARKRPMRPVLDALRVLGADIADEGRGLLPFTVHGTGTMRGGRVEVDASLSSQFVSGLLLSAPRFTEGVHVVHTGDRLPSVPHIEMTLETLRARGVEAESPSAGQWRVAPGPIRSRNVTIETDLSNAAPFLSAALAAGGSVTVPHWPTTTTQVGDQLRELLLAFGAKVTRKDDTVTVTSSGALHGVQLHIPDAGELAPTLVGLAALAAHGNGEGDGLPSQITGIGHIRQHETDRIAALVAEINALGGRAEELPDGIAIHPATLQGGSWHSYEDHRMATTGALIGLRVPGIIVDDIDCTAKTLPQFPELWARLVGVTPVPRRRDSDGGSHESGEFLGSLFSADLGGSLVIDTGRAIGKLGSSLGRGIGNLFNGLD